MSIRKHTAINITGSVIPIFVMLITVPLYLKILGDIRYGVLALVWLMLGYFSVLDIGLGKATANLIARLEADSANERSKAFWTALLLNFVLGLIGAIVLWYIGEYLILNVLKIPEEFQQEILLSLPWLVATLPLILISSVLNGALEGRKQFLILNILQVTDNILFQVLPLIAIYFKGSSLAVVIPIAVLSRTLMNVPKFITCYICVPFSIRPLFSQYFVRSLFSFGGWVAITNIVGTLVDTIDRFLIGVVLGAQAVTYYVIPMQLVSKIKIIPGSFSRALFPRFSAEATETVDNLAFEAIKVLIVVMTILIISGLLLLRPFMELWVGEEFARIAAPIGEILLFGVWLNSLAHIPYFLLQGKRRPDVVAKIQLLEFVPFLFVIWFGMQRWGIYGAVVAWTARIIFEAIFLFWLSGIGRKVLSPIIGIGSLIVLLILSINNIDIQSLVWRFVFVLLLSVFLATWVVRGGWYKIFSSSSNR